MTVPIAAIGDAWSDLVIAIRKAHGLEMREALVLVTQHTSATCVDCGARLPGALLGQVFMLSRMRFVITNVPPPARRLVEGHCVATECGARDITLAWNPQGSATWTVAGWCVAFGLAAAAAFALIG